MSSKHNDTIHLGNYEEYFILYMDGELSPEGVEEVDRFLEAHPDLRGELDLLMGTKLPAEDLSFDKSFLLADSMKLGAMGEDLLLYVDGELPEDRKAVVAAGIESDPDIARMHAQLALAKLDPADVVAYPNKAELYRHTERVVFFKPWMRAAAAVLLIGSLSLFYFGGNGAGDPAAGTVARTGTQPEVKPASPLSSPVTEAGVVAQTTENKKSALPVGPVPAASGEEDHKAKKNPELVVDPVPATQNLIAHSGGQDEIATIASVQPMQTIEAGRMIDGAASTGEPVVATIAALNNSSVTNLLSTRINDSNPPVETASNKSGSTKGKVKGFLRKATTLIEKRTGIDPTDEDGKLLIGALAVKLD